MGKEAKIGLAVILSLLVVLGVVIAIRLTSLTEDAAADTPEDQADAAPPDAEPSVQAGVAPPVKRPERVASDRDTADKKSTAVATQKPTVLSPERAEPPASSTTQWRQLAAGKGQSSPPESADTASAPPSYMPRLRPSPDEPSGRYGTASAAPLPPDTAVGYATTEKESADSLRKPSFEERQVQPPAAPIAPAGPYGNPRPYAPSHSAEQRSDVPDGGNRGSATTRAISDSRLGAEFDPAAGRRSDGTYEVQPNDSFWNISEKLYGTGAYFRALAEHNRSKVANQNDLQVGLIITAPDVAELEQTYPEFCPKPEHRYVARHQTTAMRVGQHGADATYTVAEGDTLYRIARYELGDASRWHEIYKLNREVIGQSFNHLRPGTQLILPGKAGAEPVDELTRRPGSLY